MRTLLATAALAALVACGPIDTTPRLAAYQALVPGRSTAQDAVAMLGRPISETVVGPNRVLLQWMTGGGSQHVAISFAPDGRMIGVQHIFGL